MPASSESISMMLLLQTHFQSELLQDVSCGRCGVVGPHTVRPLLGEWPPTLFVQLKRWGQRRGAHVKLSTSVVDYQHFTIYGT